GFTYAFDFDEDGDTLDPGEQRGLSATRQHVFDTSGLHAVTGWIYDKDDGSTSRSVTVTIAPNTPPSFAPFPDRTVYQGSSFVKLGGAFEVTDPDLSDIMSGQIDWGFGDIETLDFEADGPGQWSAFGDQ